MQVIVSNIMMIIKSRNIDRHDIELLLFYLYTNIFVERYIL